MPAETFPLDGLALAADFPAATRSDWLARVEGVLKGADFDKRLVSRSADGLRIEPLYERAVAATGLARAESGSWRVCQRVDHPDPTAANELALADLEGGADALALVFSEAPSAHGYGLRAETVDDLDRALSGVLLDLVHMRLDAGGRGRQAAALLVSLAERRGHRLGDLRLDLGLDPIGAMAAMGRLSAPWGTVAARCADTLAGLDARGFAGQAFLADGRPYHEGGASEAQELAGVLATALAYLRALEAGGHSLDPARAALSFLLVADADEFLTIAKFRALRGLWARVEAACGLAPEPIRVHAETAWRMLTRRDPHVNLLRGTLSAFSAGIGGADSIAVLPFTTALGLPDAFARRLARNTQLVLLEEASLARVGDPAAGAGGFEALTRALTERAWGLFQEIESEGGILESLREGKLQARIAAVRVERERAVATRRDPITGTSEFPNLADQPVRVLMDQPPASEKIARSDGKAQPLVPAFSSLVEAASRGADLTELAFSAAAPEPVKIVALPSIRSAEPFERLRDRSDAFLARKGRRPRVFLANLGTRASFAARAAFVKNAFEAGGIEVIENDGCGSNEALVQAFSESKAKLACLCGSDETYLGHAMVIAAALRAAGASHIHLVGRPKHQEPEWGRAGFGPLIYVGCDMLRVLVDALDAASA